MKKTILAATLAAAFALPAHAHEMPSFNFELDLGPILAEAEDARQDWGAWGREFSHQMENSMTYMFTDRAGRGRVVKGHPYSADIVTETRQSLSDGNVISHTNVNKVWRDTEGRTRQETYRGEKLRSIYISDPVAAMSYTLIPGSKIAVAVPRHDFSHPHPASAPRPRASRSTTETTSDGKRVVVRTVESDGGPGVREEVRVQVVRVGDDSSIVIAPTPPTPPVPPTLPTPPVAPVPPVPPVAMIPGVHTMRFESMGSLGKGETKTLGTKDFEGVKAEGKSTTWTIPAGKIGNQKPIDVVSESWYSPELQVTVYSRYNDPRTGESIYRLASLRKAEPQPDLFTVPADYETKGRGSKEKAPKPPKPPKE